MLFRSLATVFPSHDNQARIIINRGTAYKAEDFYTELEKRERLIKTWLVNNLGEEENTVARGST